MIRKEVVMDFGFSQILEQRLSLNQMQLFSLKLLSMDSLELEKYINEAQLENPFIQINEEAKQNSEPVVKVQDSYEKSWKSRRSNEEAESWENYIVAEEKQDLYRFFWEQISQNLSNTQNRVLRYMTEIMDDTGMVRADDREIAVHLKCSEQDVCSVRKMLSHAEPAGCGSRNLIDCILVQMEQKKIPEEQLALCRDILTEYLQDLAKGNYGKIARNTGHSKETVQAILSLIKQSNPIPLNGYGERPKSYIIPDIVIEFEKNEWTISLNRAYTNCISISADYEQLMQEKMDSKTKSYCMENKKSANLLKKCLDQRNDTLLRLANAIFTRQYEFVRETGPLNPMKLNDIAADINVHESTVSRAIKDKYIQFPRGIYPIKELFVRSCVAKEAGTGNSGTAVSKAPESAEDVSTSAIKEQIRKLIYAEDKKNPLSDQMIADQLCNAGFRLSRRTVAKYRETMKIGSTRLRKTL